ncbi:hypothetical protein F5Y04DRAFT_255839 [Hypomontagnella monticulosa]|nr:hypothetical protein F5Y04DRAFT_255839 [Hypomontagnella monticulosa]
MTPIRPSDSLFAQDNSTANAISLQLQLEEPTDNHVFGLPTNEEVAVDRRVQYPTTGHGDHDPSRKRQDYPVLAVIGRAGSGKSSFISKLAVEDYVGTRRHNTLSKTHLIEEVECEVRGRRVLIIDTLGFDDIAVGGVTVLECIAEWLQHSSNNTKILSGLIYMHDIMGPQVGRSSVKSFQLLRKITGQRKMNRVILLTTKWDNRGGNQLTYVDRETQLQDDSDFWKGMIADCATVMRHDGTAASAEKITFGLLDETSAISNTRKHISEDGSLDLTVTDTYINEELMKYQQQIEALSRKLERVIRKNRDTTALATQVREHHRKISTELNKMQGLLTGAS